MSLAIRALAQVPSIDLTSEEQTWIQQNPTLTATNNMDLVPLDYVENGISRGFAIDYINLVAKKVGLNITYVNGKNWDELVEMTRDQEIDIIHSLVQNPARDEFLNFTSPYLDHVFVTFGKEGSPKLDNINDMSDKRIGVIGGWATGDFFRLNYPEYTLIQYDGLLDALRGISNGEIDVLPASLHAVNYYKSRYFLNDIVIIGDDFVYDTNNTIQHRLASRLDLPILRDILQKGMDAVSEEEYNELIEKWNLQLTNLANVELSLTAEELSWLAANKKFRVATDPGSVPTDFIDVNGNISGISGSYLKRIEELLDIEFEWIGNDTWVQGYESLLKGDADIISLVIPSEERAQNITFTDSYFNGAYVIFAREGELPLTTLSGLAGRKIVQVRDLTITNNIKRDYPDIKVTEVETPIEALQLLSSGGADAYVTLIPIASYHMASNGLTNLQVVGNTEYITPFSIGIRNELPILASVMQKTMKHLLETERNRINSEWLSLRITQEQDYTLLLQIVTIFLIVVILILFWVRSLRNEIARRKIVENELNRALDVKSTFFGHMSHELRTPLNAIIGFSEMMLVYKKSPDFNAKVEEYANYINSGGRHLLNLVNDILDQNKIEAGEINVSIENLNIKKLISEYIEELKPITNQKNQKIIIDPNSKNHSIFSDRRLFKQVIFNILSNAQKYSPADTEIKILINKSDYNHVDISIEDKGDGIPQDVIEQLSDYKDNQTAHFIANAEGTGLGLIIVDQLMRRLNGKLKIDSTNDEGASVTLSFPHNFEDQNFANK